ncbi:GNAT family N-acetyltransferase [Ligilactobacillus pobuzihii]|uniref:GNAT family acetyltransferase n=1 Tax=Ligilactobacillus pobuzihii TaxID=449659 RepID=A0A0R2LJU8_9LACO|nr:GNAT family N-acetyltransferase [Ligilactobacillus pobuzihii]KRK10243.1 GNAT family acetyltransferase [Ligilactobacillus pobuzihii E100301 = KCTC 13174]KRO02084.1 GNAT family acetyltransferase [Ligilactobacillus pobuzihii]GEN48158.1 N-acetyltransferase [Ligilactobacillus pobuzihii]
MLKIKPVTLNQLAQLQEISRQTFLDTFGSDNTSTNMQAYLNEAYSAKKLTNELKDPNSFFFFACFDKTILGYLKLNVNNAQTEKMPQNALEIERIYVKKEYKHQRIGTKLFQKALDLAKSQQKNTLWLGVWENNPVALKFYSKLGFEQIGDHIFQLGDDPQRDLIMQKRLGSNKIN